MFNDWRRKILRLYWIDGGGFSPLMIDVGGGAGGWKSREKRGLFTEIYRFCKNISKMVVFYHFIV
jgi:hypothetical protein